MSEVGKSNISLQCYIHPTDKLIIVKKKKIEYSENCFLGLIMGLKTSVILLTLTLFFYVMRRPTERERTECMIKAKLRNIMMFQDLENITSKEVYVMRLLCHGLHKHISHGRSIKLNPFTSVDPK